MFRETAVRNQNMAVGIKLQKISKGLGGDDSPGDGFIAGEVLLINAKSVGRAPKAVA